MMWWSSGESSNSVLNLRKKQSRRQLRATEELSRNSERGTENHLGDKEPSIIFRNSLETQENQGQVEKPVEPANGARRADLRERWNISIMPLL